MLCRCDCYGLRTRGLHEPAGEWFDGRNVEKRTDFELGRDAISRVVYADEHAGSRQHGHFRVTDFIGLAVRHNEPKRLERTLGQEIAKGL